jgi:hypothetical protein
VVKKISENFAAHFPEKKVKGRLHGFNKNNRLGKSRAIRGCLLFPKVVPQVRD